MMTNFSAYDNFLYDLYAAEDPRQMRETLFSHLKEIIPHDYASIFMISPSVSPDNEVQVSELICEPGEFADAERAYLEKHADEARKRLALTGETSVVRLSSVESEDERLNTAVYRECYQAYNIYDILQLSIRHDRELLAVMSLFRTRESGGFADEDVYLIKTLRRHLNTVFYRFGKKENGILSAGGMVSEITSRVHMTPKETQILTMIFLAKSNDEICDALKIKEHTLQKHFQNIYRKLNISSRWELLRFAVNGR